MPSKTFALFVFILAFCVLPSQQSTAQWDACLPLAETPSECDSICTATSCPTGQSCTPVFCDGACVAGCKCGTYLDCDFDGSAGAVCKGMEVRDDKPTFCLPFYDTCLGTVDDIPTEPCIANPNICATSGGTCDAFLGNSNYDQNKGVWPECTTLSWTYICQCGYENTDPCQPGYLCSDVAGCVPQQDGCLIDDTVCSPCETCSPFDICEPSGQLQGCQLLDLQAGEPEAYDFGLDNDEGDAIELRLEPCSGRLEWTVYDGRSPNTKNSKFEFSASKDGLESVGVFSYSSGSSGSFNFVAKALNGDDATFRAYLYEYNKPNTDPLFPRLGGELGSQEVAWKYTNNGNNVVLSWPSSPDNSRVEYCVYASPTAVEGVYELHGSPCAIDETTLVECVTDKTSLTVDISSAADADWYFDVLVQWQEGQGPSEDNQNNLGLSYRAAYVAASTLVPSGTGGNDYNNVGGSPSSGSSSSAGSNSSSGASSLTPMASLLGLLVMGFLYLIV